MPASFRLSAACAAMLLAAMPAGAQLYKWVDENGTVNYSNTPPPKTKGGKPATIVEDRTSVYTPEKSVVDALERRKEQRLQPPPPPVASAPLPGVGVIAPPPPPAPAAAYDPCRNPGDPNCQIIIYDGPPAFAGRRRPPPNLVQPQIPPGTIAGQATASGGIIPGLSGVTPPAPQIARPPPVRVERDRELDRHPARPR